MYGDVWDKEKYLNWMKIRNICGDESVWLLFGDYKKT
jgi:hypothetical protein